MCRWWSVCVCGCSSRFVSWKAARKERRSRRLDSSSKKQGTRELWVGYKCVCVCVATYFNLGLFHMYFRVLNQHSFLYSWWSNLTLTCESLKHKKDAYFKGWAIVLSILNTELSKKPVLNYIFRHFVAKSLSQEHIIYSHFFSKVCEKCQIWHIKYFLHQQRDSLKKYRIRPKRSISQHGVHFLRKSKRRKEWSTTDECHLKVMS